jgi:hypothetical protein
MSSVAKECKQAEKVVEKVDRAEDDSLSTQAEDEYTFTAN